MEPRHTNPPAVSADQNPFRAKGSTLRSKLAFVARRFGEGEADALRRWLDQRIEGAVLDAAWYPFAVYDALLQEVAERFYGGELERLQEVGRFSAEEALSNTYSIYAVKRDFGLFLKRLSSLHSRFYSGGELVVTEQEVDACGLELRDLPVVSEADAHLALGFYLRAGELMGLERIRGRFERVDSHTLRYRLSWVTNRADG